MRPAIAAAIAAGLCCSTAAAWAEGKIPNDTPSVPTPPAAYAAAPYGAHYYPGIGFRYVLPPSERVYGYYAGPRENGYRARYRACTSGFWFWERDARCGHPGHRW